MKFHRRWRSDEFYETLDEDGNWIKANDPQYDYLDDIIRDSDKINNSVNSIYRVFNGGKGFDKKRQNDLPKHTKLCLK